MAGPSFSAIILDFDGVILESVDVKTEAFRSLFSHLPDRVEEIVSYHRGNTGLSRFEKFRYIYDHILGKELSDQEFRGLTERYHALVFEGVIAAPCVEGAGEFLSRFYRSVPLFVVSATPEDELKEIIRQRSMDGFFRDIFGSPRKKSDCILEILERQGLEPGQALFVGDALNDYDTALNLCMPFAGRVRPGEVDRFTGRRQVVVVVQDLTGLARFLEGRVC